MSDQASRFLNRIVLLFETRRWDNLPFVAVASTQAFNDQKEKTNPRDTDTCLMRRLVESAAQVSGALAESDKLMLICRFGNENTYVKLQGSEA
jgi:hypothetical protein